MAEIGIKELKARASEVVQRLQKEGVAYVVTKRGRPAAVLMPLEEAEDVVLAYADEFVEARHRGRREYKQGKSIPLEELD